MSGAPEAAERAEYSECHTDGGGLRSVRAVTRILALSLASMWLISFPLWITTRAYPLSPVSNWLPPIPSPMDHALVWGLLALLGVVAILPDRRSAILVFVAGAILLALEDQTRWQSWFYQYLAMFAVLGAFPRPLRDGRRARQILNDLRIIVASVYFWSGLQKANRSFVDLLFPSLIDPLIRWLPAGLEPAIASLGPLAPVVEVGIALGLMFPRTRRVAVVAAVFMHAFILASLGLLRGFGHPTIWPWNIAMPAFVILLFGQDDTTTAREIFASRQGAIHWVVVILFACLPVLSFANLWDSNLSFTMHSGNVRIGTIRLVETAVQSLPERIRRLVQRDQDGRFVLGVATWSSAVFRTPPYPEVRVFRVVARSLCRPDANPSDVQLIVRGRSIEWSLDPYAVLASVRPRILVFDCKTL